MDLDRAHEWIEGLTRITEVTGPVTTAGTRYTAWFGRMRSPSEILEVERPRLVRTRFGSWLLRGVEQATLEDQADGTRLTQEFGRTGSSPGSWQGSSRSGVQGQLPGRT
jgi:hypothetical protein